MTAEECNVGAYVRGSPFTGRKLVRHADLLTAYADASLDDTGEAYLSHFVFGDEMRQHYGAKGNSVAGYAGPCWCRWLVFDIDRPDLAAALADARALVRTLDARYPEMVDTLTVYFSGGKGFHVLLELRHAPLPCVGFNAVAGALARMLASKAGIVIDDGIYDIARIIRLPNTRHPKSGLFKRRIDAADLFQISIDGIRDRARHAEGDGLPTGSTVPQQLRLDWDSAVRAVAQHSAARSQRRIDTGNAPDARAPRYYTDFVQLRALEGERHATLFRCAAWLTEQGAPPSLVHALLTEPGLDSGLPPKDVTRQIQCGIQHAAAQRPHPTPTPPDPTNFPFGALAAPQPTGELPR
ncbi:MAG: hypothetical protein ACRCZF_26960 [Gemmataceae bacterium]